MKAASRCWAYGSQWDKIKRVLRLTYEFACSHSQRACSSSLKQSVMGRCPFRPSLIPVRENVVTPREDWVELIGSVLACSV